MSEEDDIPPIPGMWRLGWLLFFQPLKLHKLFMAWGLEGDPSLWALRHRLRKEPHVRTLVRRLLLLAVILIPLGAGGGGELLQWSGLLLNWFGVAIGVTLGVAIGVAGGVAVGVAGGVAGGVAIGVAGGVALGVATGVAKGTTDGVALGVATGVATSVAYGVADAIRKGVTDSVAYGVAVGIAGGVALGVVLGGAYGVAYGVAVGVAGGVAHTRLLLYPAHAIATWLLSGRAELQPVKIPNLVRQLPFKHHDLIYFPLPGLRSFLLTTAEHHSALVPGLLTECANSVGQRNIAAQVQAELGARALKQALQDQNPAAIIDADLDYWPEAANLPEPNPLSPFIKAAEALRAELTRKAYDERRDQLRIAQTALERGQATLIGLEQPTRLHRAVLPVYETAFLWVKARQAQLDKDEAARPEIPDPFIAGPILDKNLRPRALEVFKGRQDIVDMVDRDLSEPEPQPLYLTGQRRIGKSSLIAALPQFLGPNTTVVPINFQAFSGHRFKHEPHRWIETELAQALEARGIAANLPERGAETPWGETLEWLQRLDDTLEDRRVLVTIDEVERFKDTATTGGISRDTELSFLDFIRAAALRRIQFMLVSAYPIRRFPDWSDRLISVRNRHLGYLDRDACQELLLHPRDGFPDIYPDGGVNRIIDQTFGQPALTQAVAKKLVARLNRLEKMKANDHDLDEALADALDYSDHLPALYRVHFDDDARALMQRLAHASGPEPVPASDVRAALLEEEFIVQDDGPSKDGAPRFRVAVPLFARWIRKHHPQ